MIAEASTDRGNGTSPALRDGARRLQSLIVAKQFAAAAAAAEDFVDQAPVDGRLALFVLLAFERSGRAARALEIIQGWTGAFLNGEIAAAAMRIARAAGDRNAIFAVAARAVASGFGTAQAHVCLGLTHASRDESKDAIAHLQIAAGFGPLSVRAASTLGELLLLTGNARDALPYLSQAVQAAPRSQNIRVSLARAHRMLRQFEEAATEFKSVAAAAPTSTRWARAAIGALNQAGREEEANALFTTLNARREAALPEDFEAGLASLWGKLDHADIPAARFDWAWRLRDQTRRVDRRDWERLARWGHLADHLLLDWLECRPTRAAEAMERIAELDEFAHLSNRLYEQGRGLVLTSAHLGAMYAAPMCLELLDFPTKWLASASAVPAAAYRRSLISTSDQFETHVAKRAMATLASGQALALMVDGAMSVAAPRVTFEGQEITYSAFAARIAYKYRAPSLFVVPQWCDGRIDLMVRALPDAQRNESLKDYLSRWRAAYLAALRDALAAEPENLRLGGGIWRHIK